MRIVYSFDQGHEKSEFCKNNQLEGKADFQTNERNGNGARIFLGITMSTTLTHVIKIILL